MNMALTLKRAARFNPAWKPALIYKIATDDAGDGLTDDAGTFLYDLTEETFGRLAFDQEERVWVDDTPWQGNATICVISSLPPDPMTMILLDDTFYQVLEVRSGDGNRPA